MYFESYREEAILPKTVEGRFETKVNDVQPGTMKDGTRFTRVDLIINAQGYPHVSLFLTDGPNFNAHFTAFCDTFGLPRGNQNFEQWKGQKGWLDISVVEKDGYKNMRPSYILDENGWVVRPNNTQPQQAAPQQPQYNPAPQQPQMYGAMSEGEDIPF